MYRIVVPLGTRDETILLSIPVDMAKLKRKTNLSVDVANAFTFHSTLWSWSTSLWSTCIVKVWTLIKASSHTDVWTVRVYVSIRETREYCHEPGYRQRICHNTYRRTPRLCEDSELLAGRLCVASNINKYILESFSCEEKCPSETISSRQDMCDSSTWYTVHHGGDGNVSIGLKL